MENELRVASKIALDQITVFIVIVQFAIQVSFRGAMEGARGQAYRGKSTAVEFVENVVLHFERKIQKQARSRRHDSREEQCAEKLMRLNNTVNISVELRTKREE
jgi:hypothetical protein